MKFQYSEKKVKVELLDLGDLQRLLGFGSKGGFLLGNGALESAILQPTGQTGLVLTDLSFNGADAGINGGEHIRSGFLCTAG